MGSVWLGSLPDVCRSAGLNTATWPGWETRSRGSGGYDSILGIQVHHTASSGTYPNSEMAYMWDNAQYRPIGAIYLAPDGKVTVGAAGATNTSGRGGPMQTTRGTIPLNAGNRYLIAIEAANRGDGTPWPVAQQDAYVTLCAALAKAYMGGIILQPGDLNAHFEWTTRKVDPAGQSRYASGANKWNMTAFRKDVTDAIVGPPPPPPTGPPYPPTGADMFTSIQPYRNSDTRVYGGPLVPRKTYEFGLNPAIVPQNATAVAVNVAMLPKGQRGFMSVWPGPESNPVPNTSVVNAEEGGAHNGACVVGCPGGKVNVMTSVPADVILDVTGYWTP